ncbi:MAG TPA: YbdK family carboxylate-amine ligase [Gaiellaceae bacterium]
MIEQHFGESSPFSLGVEEEVMILDAETLAPVAGVDVLVRGAEGLDLPGTLKTELHASVVELNTHICASAGEALDALRQLRTAADSIARANGLRIAAAGTHPLARPEDLPVVPEKRYEQMISEVGKTARRQGVNGVHVHVGVPSPDACFHAIEGILQWLPLVLALSVNSPYLAGVETGLLSNRAVALGELPRSGAPPAFRSYADWEAWVERLVRLGVFADYTRIWWDVRPHPRFGTVELRMPDQPTSVDRTASFAALAQALVATVLESPPRPYEPERRGDYAHNRWAALRFGMGAELIHPDGDRFVPATDLRDELLELVGAAAASLGGAALLDVGEPEAGRQLAVGRKRGLEALCVDLAERTVSSP